MKNENFKALYETPKITVAELDSLDVITTSGALGGDGWNNSSYIDPSGWT